MGKKSSQSCSKISKKPQHPLNSLIKNLRPKVYIIDSSNFKNLVQQLTGNNENGKKNSPVPLSPPLAPTVPPPAVEKIKEIIEIQDDHDHAYQENSNDYLSYDSSTTCFSTPSQSPDLQYQYQYQLTQSVMLESLKNMDAYQENSNDYLSYDSSTTCFSTPSESPDLQYRPSQSRMLENSKNMDFSSEYGVDIDSLLFEMDQMMQQEVCVYDYDFSGLI